MGEPRTAEWWPRSDRSRRSSWSKQLVEATFSSWACSWGPRWLFCRLLTGGLTIRQLTAALREHLPSDVGTDREKIFFVKWYAVLVFGVFFFFFIRTTIVASLDDCDSSMCSVQKCTFWQRGAEPTCKGPERLFRTSDLDVPSLRLTTSAFLECSSLFVTYCANATTKEVRRSARIRRHPFLELVPRSAHFLSQWRTSSESCKGSYDRTADSFSQSPMLSATRSPKSSEGAQWRNTRKKNQYRYSCRC